MSIIVPSNHARKGASISRSWHFNFLRGHSLVELTEHDDSAADIIVQSTYIYVLLPS